MLSPVNNFKNNTYTSKRVAPYRPFFMFDNRRDVCSFKGSSGSIGYENSKNLESLSRAYKEIVTALDFKTDEGIKKIESDIDGLKLWKGISFSNAGKKKNNIYLNIPQTKKAGNIIKIVVSNQETKSTKTYLIKDFSRILKNPVSKTSDNYEFLTKEEIEKNGIDNELKEIINDLDPLLLKLRISVRKRSGQDLKPMTALLSESLSEKLKNIKKLNFEIDGILDTKSRKTVTKLKDEFGDYNGITGQAAHMFKNVGPDRLKIVCSTVQNIDHGEMMRLLVFNEDNEIEAGFLIKDFDKIVSNYNPKYIAVIPEKLTFVDVNEIEKEKYSKELPELLALAESKLESFKTFLLTPAPAPKNTGFLDKNDFDSASNILSCFNEITKSFESLSSNKVFKIKDSYPNLETAAGKRGFTFKTGGGYGKKISVLPVHNKYNSDLTRICVSYDNEDEDKIFLLKDNNKVVKNYNPEYPMIIPEVLKYYDEDEIKTLAISRHLKELENEIKAFRDYVFSQTCENKPSPVIKPKERTVLKIPSSVGSASDKKAYKLLIKNCKQDFNKALETLEEKPEAFKEVMAAIQKRVDEYLAEKNKNKS